jgi:rRNA-processing protein FCF1
MDMHEVDVVRTSTMTGIKRTKTFMVDPNQLLRYNKGEIYIQEAFPHLSADDREFIISGCTPEEFERLTPNG